MINYTDRLGALVRDIIARVPALSELDPDGLLVFARYGRSGAAGPYATCHCLTLPPTDPGYYYWCDTRSGHMTRRSEWFVTKSPSVSINGRPVHYLISFALPRFADQSLDLSRKRRFYPGAAPWIAKLDTIVHELYHVDPGQAGLRRLAHRNGDLAAAVHGPGFLEDVAEMVHWYLASGADPGVYDFLRHGFDELSRTFGPVTATTFRTFPSFPQRYVEKLDAQPPAPPCECIQPIRRPQVPTVYTERDLETRLFLPPAAFVAACAAADRGRSVRPSRTLTLKAPRPEAAADALIEA